MPGPVISVSMAPASLAEVRAILAERTLAQCQAAAAAALTAADPAAARAWAGG
jgi:phosphotransferase system enzyme I (PtsI)